MDYLAVDLQLDQVSIVKKIIIFKLFFEYKNNTESISCRNHEIPIAKKIIKAIKKLLITYGIQKVFFKKKLF